MVDPSEPDKKKPSLAQRSAAARFAIFFLSILLLFVAGLIALALARCFYWDQDQKDAIFLWDAFLFFLIKGPAVKYGGATVVGILGALITAAAGFFRGKRAVANVVWLCVLGIVLTFILWIMLSQNEELMGEVSVMAGRAFVEAPPDDRILAVSAAIDSAMGAFALWWTLTAGTVLGLSKLPPAAFTGFFRYFSRQPGRGEGG